jgi:hypothetical protein
MKFLKTAPFCLLVLCFGFRNGFHYRVPTNLACSDSNTVVYALLPGPEIYLPAGGHAAFSILERATDTSAFEAAPQNLSNKWTVNGKELEHQDPRFGKLVLQEINTGVASYYAPTVPPSDPITIAVEFSSSEIDGLLKDKTKNILICTIHIIEASNYFFLGANHDKFNSGKAFELHEPLNRKNDMAEVAMFDRGQWTISISGMEKDLKNMSPMSMAISFAGNGKGTYPFSIKGTKETGIQPPSTIVSVSGMKNGTPLQYISADCTPHDNPSECNPHTLNGTITITEFDEKNKIIKGYFYGQVMSPDYNYSYVSGGFRAYMK